MIIVLVLSPVALYILSEVRGSYIAFQEESLLREARLLVEIIKPQIEKKTVTETLLADLQSKTGLRIAVFGAKGGRAAHLTAPDPAIMETEEVKEALGSGIGTAVRKAPPGNHVTLYAALPIREDAGKGPEGGRRETLAILRVSQPLRSAYNAYWELARDALGIVTVIAAVILIAIAAWSAALSRSLDKLIRVSNEIAHGRFDVAIPFRSIDGDLHKLSNALGQMAERLKELFEEAAYEKTQLQAVLSAMSEGVMAVAEDGRVILVNDSIKTMFNLTEEYIGKPHWEVVRHREITEILEQAQKERVEQKREISLHYPEEGTFRAIALPLTAPVKGSMLILYDITEFKRLEMIKADFVANVSHELRTPLTAVKGYVETLLDSEHDTEQSTHFLGIIERHTERLINIVNDLLILSELERKAAPGAEQGGEGEGEFEEVDLRDVLNSSREALRSRMEKKGIRFTLEPAEKEAVIKGDGFLLEQLFINLIDNAVKYSPEGGSVKVYMESRRSGFVVHVEDTGIGIPSPHIPRIFERFYRVDKTRSSKEGGTGLGLSIVKHIAILHGGKVEVASEPGKGSRFTVVLPSYIR